MSTKTADVETAVVGAAVSSILNSSGKEILSYSVNSVTVRQETEEEKIVREVHEEEQTLEYVVSITVTFSSPMSFIRMDLSLDGEKGSNGSGGI